jgi:membrane protein implicated in regulation of membrane protease activity
MLTTFLWVCAIAGSLAALLGVLFDGAFDLFDIDLGPDWLSVPVVGVGVGAFGVSALTIDSLTGLTALALLIGLVVAVAFVAATSKLLVALMRSTTDPTPTTETVVGATGRVVTPIAGGRGEVLLTVAGYPRKFTATADEELAVGAGVVAVMSVSDTTVHVMATHTFWGEVPGEGRNPQ